MGSNSDVQWVIAIALAVFLVVLCIMRYFERRNHQLPARYRIFRRPIPILIEALKDAGITNKKEIWRVVKNAYPRITRSEFGSFFEQISESSSKRSGMDATQAAPTVNAAAVVESVANNSLQRAVEVMPNASPTTANDLGDESSHDPIHGVRNQTKLAEIHRAMKKTVRR